MIDCERTAQAPAGLDNPPGAYRSTDVVERLWLDFFHKCYLCETPIEKGGFEIDHRRPVGDGGAVCAWSNLFPACGDCNGRRPKRWPVGGLLDPTVDRVEGQLQQWLDDECYPHFIPSNATVIAKNTADELVHIHCDSRSAKAADLRATIERQLRRVLEKVVKWMDLRARVSNSADIARIEDELRLLVSRRSPYTMLIRSRVEMYIGHLFD